jgi:hypothetical protein
MGLHAHERAASIRGLQARGRDARIFCSSNRMQATEMKNPRLKPLPLEAGIQGPEGPCSLQDARFAPRRSSYFIAKPHKTCRQPHFRRYLGVESCVAGRVCLAV